MSLARTFDVDVLVCGGGVAGASAGIAAARAGARTLLLESRESLGGLCTNGFITGIAGLVDGICAEWIDRLAVKNHALKRDHLPLVEPEYGKMELEQMLLQSGCRILYGAHVVDSSVTDGKITHVVAYSKSGRMEIRAKVFIDCTGDADVAASAGVPYDIGNAEFCGLNESVSMGFRLSYVNLNEYQAAEAKYQEENKNAEKRSQLIREKEFEAIEKGDLPFLLVPGLLVYPVPGGNPDCCDVTMDATQSYYCHNDDCEDLTRQIIDQHNQVQWFVEFLRKYIPGFENCRLASIADMNGVRDSRRIVGRCIVRDEDVAGGTKYPDSITQFPEFYDAHHPTCGNYVAVRHIHVTEPVGSAVCRPSTDENDGNMHPFVRAGGYEARPNPRDWCEVPYRALVPVNINNLLVAGRCISAGFHALGGLRVIATCMTMGQAAGTAAAMAVKENCEPADLDGVRVRAALVEQGLGLDHAPGGYWEFLRNMEGEFVVGATDYIVISNPETYAKQFNQELLDKKD